MSKYSKNIPPSIIGAIGWFYDDIKEEDFILDFGCSTGYYGSYFKVNKHCSVYGVEISEDKNEAAKVLDGVYSFDIDGVWPEEIYERQYDAIFFGDVIEHLKHPEEALKKSLRLLNKNGKIYISTPNVAHLSVRLELLGGGFEYESMGILDNTHLKYFTLKTLEDLCYSAGYNIVRVDASLSDYPKEITKEILKKYGLTPNEKFWELTRTNEARAFQYKLVLSKSNSQKRKKSKNLTTLKPEQYKSNYIENINSEITRSRDRISQLETINKNLNDNLVNILNSRTYKLTKKLSSAKGKLSRNNNPK